MDRDTIKYKQQRDDFIAVYIGRRRVGSIIGDETKGYTYATYSPRRPHDRPSYGPTFRTLAECKRSLEEP